MLTRITSVALALASLLVAPAHGEERAPGTSPTAPDDETVSSFVGGAFLVVVVLLVALLAWRAVRSGDDA